MTTRPKRDSTGRSPHRTPTGRLLSSAEYVDTLLPAYYAVLDDYDDFRRSLAQLRVRLRLDESFRSARSKWDPEDVTTWHGWPPDALVNDRARRRVESFVKRWRLPQVSVRDVIYAISLVKQGKEPRLRKYVSSDASWGSVLIKADAPDAFYYTPHMSGRWARSEARRGANEVYAEMERQVEAAERQWRADGRRPLHPQHFSKAATRTGALRLFRRAVLRWSWQRIARAEYPEPPPGREREPVPDSAVRESVKRWGKMLGVPLPKGRASPAPALRKGQ